MDSCLMHLAKEKSLPRL